jgi:hypothetical protein
MELGCACGSRTSKSEMNGNFAGLKNWFITVIHVIVVGDPVGRPRAKRPSLVLIGR